MIRSGGGRSGEVFNVSGERMTIGRSPDAEIFLDDVTVSRNHALLVRRRDGLYIDDLGSLNGTYVNRRRIESHKLLPAATSQVGKYKSPTWTSEHRGRGERTAPEGPDHRGGREAARARVPRHLDLEDPLPRGPEALARRTPGGYRLYSPGDVQRLKTILRLQRDEFLPLRVIRQELAAGRPTSRWPRTSPRPMRAACAAPPSPSRDRAPSTGSRTCSTIPARAGRSSRSRGVRRDQGRAPRRRDLLRRHRAGDRARGTGARFGVGGRNLRCPHVRRPRGGAARADPGAVAAVAEPGAAQEALEALENLAAIASHLKHLLRSATCASWRGSRGPGGHPGHPDFPKPGIVFKDITPLFLTRRRSGTPSTPWRATRGSGRSTWCPPRRAGSCSAARWRRPPARASCSPASPASCRAVTSVQYELEYGVDALEVHADAVAGGSRVAVHDDLLATGGTAEALCGLAERAGRSWEDARS